MPSLAALSAFSLGFTSLITQVILLREFLSVFSGNELVAGITLSAWLLLTGAGGLFLRLGRSRAPRRSYAFIQLLVAVLPFLSVFAARALRRTLVPGMMLDLSQSFVACFLLLLPYCLVSGYALAYLSALPVREDERQIGRVYLYDTLGGILAGVLCGLFLVQLWPPLYIGFLLFAANGLLAAAFLAPRALPLRVKALVSTAAVLVCAAAFSPLRALDERTAAYLFPGQEVISRIFTPYAALAVTRQSGQINVYQNGVPAGSSDDLMRAEEIVHYAMAQRPSPRNVLLLSGGLSGAYVEALKYRVDRVDYLELDPALLQLAAGVHPVNDPRLHAAAADPRGFLRQPPVRYDMILSALPEPASIQLNRFYTIEFFTLVKQALTTGGVFTFSVTGAENYLNPESRIMTASLKRTLSAVFKNVLVFPGGRQIFAASDEPLDYGVAKLLAQAGIQTAYVSAGYLQANLSPDRLAMINKVFNTPAEINRDLKPINCFAQVRYWLSQAEAGVVLPVVFFVLVGLCAAGLAMRAPQPAAAAALGTTGFAGLGLEVVILLAFQVYVGNLYRELSLILTAFLAGCAAGAWWGNLPKNVSLQRLAWLDLGLAAYAAGLAALFPALAESAFPFAASPLLFAGLTGLVGLITGAEFSAAARLIYAAGGRDAAQTASRVYAVDFMGSALGAAVVGAFSIPLLGVVPTCFAIAGLKILTAAALFWSDLKKPAASGAAAALVVFAVFGAAMLSHDGNRWLKGLLLLPAYHYLLLGLLAWGLVQALCPGAVNRGRFGALQMRLYRPLCYVSFGLAVFYPIFRCFFRVPYIFCHACPHKCVFGVLRPYLIPAVLITNLSSRRWCYQGCPLGTLQECPSHLKSRIRSFPAITLWLAPAVLIFTAVSYFLIRGGEDSAAFPDFYAFFVSFRYMPHLGTLLAAALLLASAFFLRRPFCTLLCPAGYLSQLLLRVGGFFAKLRPAGKSDNHG